MTVSELLGKIDSAEISEWHAFFINESEDLLLEQVKAKSDRQAQELKKKGR